MFVATSLIKSISVPNIPSLLNAPSTSANVSSLRKTNSFVIKTRAAVKIQQWYRAQPKKKPKPVEVSLWRKICFCCKKEEICEEEITIENIMSPPRIINKKPKKTLLQQSKALEKRIVDKRRESQKIVEAIQELHLRKQIVKPDLNHISDVKIIEPTDQDETMNEEDKPDTINEISSYDDIQIAIEDNKLDEDTDLGIEIVIENNMQHADIDVENQCCSDETLTQLEVNKTEDPMQGPTNTEEEN